MASTKVRAALVTLSLSAAAFVGLLTSEGYSDKAYPDPVHGPSVPTIGFGTTGGVKMGDVTTPVKAAQRSLKDVQSFEGALKRCVKVPLHQGEYDAYVDLSYNIGSANFCGSTLVRRLNAQDYAGACDAILMWDRAGPVNRPEDRCSHPKNRTCRGLWERRLELHEQCKKAGE